MRDMPSWVMTGLAGFMLAGWLTTLPFSDAAQYRKAIEECEKTPPRDQHCVVVGVPAK